VVSAAIVGAVAAFFGLKATGRLPGASLVDRGMLADRERVIVSEFGSPAADSALGGAVTEAFRIDLSQSPAVTVVQPDYVRQTLQRMQRDPHARLAAALAREGVAHLFLSLPWATHAFDYHLEGPGGQIACACVLAFLRAETG